MPDNAPEPTLKRTTVWLTEDLHRAALARLEDGETLSDLIRKGMAREIRHRDSSSRIKAPEITRGRPPKTAGE